MIFCFSAISTPLITLSLLRRCLISSSSLFADDSVVTAFRLILLPSDTVYFFEMHFSSSLFSSFITRCHAFISSSSLLIDALFSLLNIMKTIIHCIVLPCMIAAFIYCLIYEARCHFALRPFDFIAITPLRFFAIYFCQLAMLSVAERAAICFEQRTMLRYALAR